MTVEVFGHNRAGLSYFGYESNLPQSDFRIHTQFDFSLLRWW